MPGSGYVPCAGTVPQQLGRTVSTGGSVEPTHSVPDTIYPAGEEIQTLDDTGGSIDPTHSVPDTSYPGGEETETVGQTGGSVAASHSGPWQNPADGGTSLPPQQPGPVGVAGDELPETGNVVDTGNTDGIIYVHPIGGQSYSPPEEEVPIG